MICTVHNGPPLHSSTHIVENARSDESAVLIMADTPAASSRAAAKDWPGPFFAMSRRREPKGEEAGSSKSEKAAIADQPMTMEALRRRDCWREG